MTTDDFQLTTDGSRFPNSAFVFESPKPGALLPPDVERLFRLYHDPLVRYLTGVAGRPDAIGESFDVGGPEVLTYRQMIERIGRLRRRRPFIVEVPILSPRLSSYWLHLVTPVRASVARPLVEGLRNATVAEDERIRKLVPFPLTPFDAAAEEALTGAAAVPNAAR